MKVTTIYKVYGDSTGGESVLDAEFYSIADACSYAVATKGKIAYGLPAIRKYNYLYNPKTQQVSMEYERLSEESIYKIANEVNVQEDN